ncbi:hypothetical protein B0H11DRAFT_2228465 [Mycena galericulata]|nr:hypothetical protein B0H11DRAFT_2228465 [Mycena galericulata]
MPITPALSHLRLPPASPPQTPRRHHCLPPVVSSPPTCTPSLSRTHAPRWLRTSAPAILVRIHCKHVYPTPSTTAQCPDPRHLEAVANPIMQKLYGAEGGFPRGAGGFPGGAPGGFPGASADGPSVEEVDSSASPTFLLPWLVVEACTRTMPSSRWTYDAQ